MGTNYYVKRNIPADLTSYCKTFNNNWDNLITDIERIQNEEIHLGKSSAGWRFLFHETEFYRNFPEFKEFINSIGVSKRFKDYHIEDEYGDRVNSKELLDLIEKNNLNLFVMVMVLL